jgi:hypothetical protein
MIYWKNQLKLKNIFIKKLNKKTLFLPFGNAIDSSLIGFPSGCMSTTVAVCNV